MLDAAPTTTPPFLRFNAITGWPLETTEHRVGMPDIDGPLRLANAGRGPIPVTDPMGSFGGRTLPRGLAISSGGRLFLVDTDAREVLTALANAGAGPRPTSADARWPFVPLWQARPLPPEAAPHDLEAPAGVPSDPYTLMGPTDVAVAPGGDLVILDPPSSRILVIAFPTAVLRQVLTIPDGAPTAIAFDCSGHAYVADPALRTVHRFDSAWRRDAGFEPEGSFAPSFIAAAAGATCGCGDKCADGCTPLPPAQPVAYTLDDTCKVRALYATGATEVVEAPDALTPPALRRGPGGNLFFADPAYPGHAPLRIAGLDLTGDGRLRDTALPIMARPRRIEVPRAGHLITDMIDSGNVGFAWDRLALSLEQPADTRLVIQTMTSDSAIRPDRIAVQPETAWSTPLVLLPGDVPEVLVQSPPGRYLWIRLDLSGDGTTTPAIHELDVFGPRRSSLHDLPPTFQQDPESARFLDRYLSYFDTLFAEIAARNADIATLFDPDTVPFDDGFLAWLGSWFDWTFLAEWDEATRREMIRDAITYFRQRGTVDGVRQIVRWHTGLPEPLPQVIEHFRLGPAGLTVGGVALDPGPAPHRFTLILPGSAVPTPEAMARLKRLVAASVPAHCRFQIQTFRPGIEVGRQSLIGVDTLLGSLDPSGLGAGYLGGTFSTPGPAATGPVTIHASLGGSPENGGYQC